MREDLRIYVENVTDNINNLSGTNLDNYLFDLFKTVGTENTFELDEENILDLRSSREKIDFLEEILNNIERQDDKDIFLRELLTYEKYLDSSVISYFRDKVQVPEGLDDAEDSNEEPEEEQELEEPSQSFDSDTDATTETNSDEEPEEELEEIETRTIKMQYPNQADHPDLRTEELWDGLSHNIVVSSNNFFEFNLGEEKYYLLKYKDNNLEAMTLLKLNENNEIVNVPLDDYLNANEIIRNVGEFRKADINILPEEIKLGQLEKTADLINKAKGGQQKTTEEGPAITEYKAKTAEMEKELEELMAKLNTPSNSADNPTKEEPEYKNAIEILKNSIKENNDIRTRLNQEPYNLGLEIIEPSRDLVAAMESATKVAILDNEIKEKEGQIESLNRDIEALTANIERMKQEGKPVNVMTYTLNGRIKERDELVKEISELKYRKEIASKSAVHLDATEIRNIIIEEIAYSNETINAIANYRREIENQKEHVPYELQLNGDGTYPDRLNNIINNLFAAQKTFENESKEINVNKPQTADIDNKELTDLAEKLKEEIEKRKENIAKYYDALNDIKNVENLVKSGRTPDDLKEDIQKINNKIDSITDDKLKEELRGELNKALNPEKEQEGPEKPEKPKNKKNDKKKWHKWMGALGLALGGAAAALIPGGFLGALAISAGAELINAGYTAYKVHQKRKHEKELEPENEITNISRIEKVKKAFERLKKDIKELNENDKWFKNITWLLHGTAIGSLAVGTAELIKGGDLINFGGTEPIQDTVIQTDPYSNVRIGDNASGLDLSKGYDQANWASQNINAENLNQAIMQDGNSIIDSVRVTKDGVTHIVDSAGKSLTEVAQQLGVNPEELVMNITNGQGAPRAWVDAAEAVGRTL